MSVAPFECLLAVFFLKPIQDPACLFKHLHICEILLISKNQILP